MPNDGHIDSDEGQLCKEAIDSLHRGDVIPSATIQRSVGLRLLKSGQYAEAEVLLRSAISSARLEENRGLEGRILQDLARAVLHFSPNDALRILSSFAELSTTALGLNLLACIHHEFFDIKMAEHFFLKAIDTARRNEDLQYQCYTTANRAGLLFEIGNVKKSRVSYEQALDGLARAGDETACAIITVNMALHEVILGNYDGALDLCDGITEQFGRIENTWYRGHRELVLGMIGSAIDERDQALTHFSSASRYGKAASDSATQAKALAWSAILKEDTGPEDLVRNLENVASDLGARGLRSDAATLLLLASRYAEARGIEGKRLSSNARIIFGKIPHFQVLTDHFARVVGVLSAPAFVSKREALPEFKTQCSTLGSLKERVQKLASTDVRILIEGESGTGKSFMARLIHERARIKRPFVVVDCTNLEENLFESKLFGHTRGAFTGAVSDSMGLVEQANGGTLFLDEIGEMPVEIQAKLLYTIEEQRYRPVGAKMEKTSNFRVIAATNRDIDEMLEEGTLRRDLYFRVAGYRVQLPPLRERREDVIPLAELQLKRLNSKYGRKKTLKPGVWEILVKYDWPGNVRELNAALERGFHLASGRRITEEDMGLDPNADDAMDLSWDSVRRAHLLRVLKLCRGNVTQAAKVLGMNRTTLIYKLKQLDLERDEYDPSMKNETESTEEAADKPSLQLVADRETERAPEERADEAE